jgi:hypothetical protein
VNLTLTTPGLREVDQLRCDTLVLHHFVSDRPLRGLAGFVDWRLNGFLSRLLLSGWVTGELQESVLMPGGQRLGVERILLMGLGHRSDYSPDRFRMVSLHTLGVLGKLGVSDFALSLPGLDALKIGSRQAVEIFLTALHQTYVTPRLASLDLQVSFVVPKAVFRDVSDPVESFERQYARR